MAGLMESFCEMVRACFRVGSHLPDMISLTLDWFIPRRSARAVWVSPLSFANILS